MPDEWKPSNNPGPYDAARVRQLEPIKTAVEKLQLPPMRSRQIVGILNALAMQVEVGGNSPEVNRLLLEALRAAVRHQVDERQARIVLDTLDGFERAESRRWEQVKSGTLPPPMSSPTDQLSELVAQLAQVDAHPPEAPRVSASPPKSPSPSSGKPPPLKKPARNAPCWCGSGKK